MSGETPPTGSGRFQSMGKKYPNSSMSSGSNHSPNGGRGGHNRSRVLASKVSAPRPINLPSLRRENANSAEWSTATSTAPTVTSGGGWGHSPSMSPFSLPQKWDNNTEPKHEWQTSNTTASPESQSSPVQSKSTTAPDASPSSPPHPQTSRAWATVSTTSTPTVSAEFPTAAETASPESDAVEKSPKTDKQQAEKGSGSDKKLVTEETEHMDWDELVREDLEKEPSLDFAEDETVLPSDRFTEDYDRSYPPQIHAVTDDATHPSSGFHRGHSRRDNAWGNTWGANSNNNHDWNGYPRSSSQERRPSGDRGAWGRRDQGGNSERGRSQTGRFGNRRPSHDRKPNFQPTVLQRPRRMSELSARSDRSSSREDAAEPHHHQQTSPTVLPAVIEGTSSGRPTELTAAQREVMLSAAERAKKRRDEEEAEYQAARERARKKAEALAALTESKSKAAKSEDKPRADDSKSSKDQQAPSSNDSEPAKLSQNKEPSPVISVEKHSPEDAKSSETVKAPETKEKATVPEKVVSTRDASPSSRSSSKSRKDANRRLNYDEDEDNKQWDSFVEGIRDNKTAEKKVSNNSNASAWNAYATRLQESSESRMNAAIDKYAAERNLDPSLFDDMRQRDRSPLRLPRHRETGRRNDRRDRDRDRRRHSRDEGRKRNTTGHRASAQELTPVEQQNVSFESWPALGQGASAKGEEKVPVGGGKDTSKKRTQDKTVDKSTPGQTVDSVDEKEEAVPDECGQSKKMSDSERTGKDEAPSVDEEPAASKGSFIAEHTDSSSEKPDTVDQDGSTQEATYNHSTEDDEPLPEMIEASESGSHISHTVPTPENEPLGRGSAFSAEAVFEHWTRAKRHEFLQKSKDPIFPEAIERLAELKPANLTFRTVHDDSRPTSLAVHTPPSTGSQSPINEEYLGDKQHAANLLLGNPSLAHSAFAASSYEGELSPQLMPPTTTAAMSGRHNYPLLVYQVPYNSRAPFMPGTAAYGVSADNQSGMFIPTSPVQQPLQQHHHQQQPVMGVYLLPPQQMLPPWPGMPVNINNQRRRH